jgi:hypothetical protein
MYYEQTSVFFLGLLYLNTYFKTSSNKMNHKMTYFNL